MSRTDAYVLVQCDHDGCPHNLEIQLTALAGGGWDERNVDHEVRRAGWVKDGDNDICDSCQEETHRPDEGRKYRRKPLDSIDR